MKSDLGIPRDVMNLSSLDPISVNAEAYYTLRSHQRITLIKAF